MLVVTLWVVTVLSILAIAIARYLSLEVRLTKYRMTREQAAALARGGVYLGVQRLSQDGQAEPYDWLGDDWASVPGASPEQPTTWVVFADDAPGDSANRSRMEIQITDMERSINLNAATEATLATPELAGSAELAKAIMDDRDPADPEVEHPVEDPPYYQKNGPFTVIEELPDIPGVADVFPKLRLLTFAARDAVPPKPEVNVNTAQRDVLLALGADAATVELLIASRAGVDGLWGTEDDCKATDVSQIISQLTQCAFGGDEAPMRELYALNGGAVFFTVKSSIFRIQSQAFAGSPPVRRRIEAVVKRSAQQGQDTTMEILSWREG